MSDPGATRLAGAHLTPFVTPELEGFFEGASAGELRLLRCDDCGAWQHPPKPACPACHSLRSTWTATSGRGRIWSWTVVHQSAVPQLAERVPYDVVLVEPDDAPGVHVVGNLVGGPVEGLHVGMAVEVAFEEAGDGVVLPVFRAVSGEG